MFFYIGNDLLSLMGEDRKNWWKIFIPDKGTVVLLVLLFIAIAFVSLYPAPQGRSMSASTHDQEGELGGSGTSLMPLWLSLDERLGWVELSDPPQSGS
jgi:hypothetical protein